MTGHINSMEKNKFYLLINLLISLICESIFFAGCKYNVFMLETDETVLFELPEWPPVRYKGAGGMEEESPYPDLSRWLIEIVSTDLCESFYMENNVDNQLKITVQKNTPVAISARPITLNSSGEEISFFKPAGAIYPYDDCILTWNGGFPVYIFQTLYKSRRETGVSAEHMEEFINQFNWKKFEKTLAQKENSAVNMFEQAEPKAVFYNPWQLDVYMLLDNLSFGSFKANLLNTKNVVSLPQKDLQLSACDLIFSSYIPENNVLWKYGEISLKKNVLSLLNVNGEFGAIIKYSSPKNISLEYVFMPIYLEEI